MRKMYDVPPQTIVSPDLTSFTASSTDSQTLDLFGTGIFEEMFRTLAQARMETTGRERAPSLD